MLETKMESRKKLCRRCGCEYEVGKPCSNCQRLYVAKYRKNNREKVLLAAKKYREENKQKEKERHIRYKKQNPESDRIHQHNRRARISKQGGKLSKDIGQKLFVLQRGKCACCGISLGKDYHLDHIIPVSAGGANEDWNIQLLTKECNLRKHAIDPIAYMQNKGFLL